MGRLGLTEILVIVGIVILLFGGKKIPELMEVELRNLKTLLKTINLLLKNKRKKQNSNLQLIN